ncbi:MAG: hypothetical protein WCA89_04545 [Terracidiphilus sp.]
MRSWELMKETLLRRRFVLILHMAWIAIYVFIFIPDLSEMHWQPVLVGFSGFLLPLFISAGIFGDDVASGRMAMLITKPMRATELYLWRAAGLAGQGIVHFAIATVIIVVMHRLTGKSDMRYAAWTVIASFLLFCCCATLSATVSVVVKREFNSAILILGTPVVLVPFAVLMQNWPNYWLTHAFHYFLKYACPPLELIMSSAGDTFLTRFLIALQAIGLTAVYAGIGTLLISARQFPQARE